MFQDREYFNSLRKIAVPIIIQQFVWSALNLLDVVMIGQLGDASVAGVGLANQVFFLLTFLLFGTSSGAAVFTAQYWGKGDVTSIRKVLGLSLGVSFVGSLLFTLVAVAIPNTVLSIYSRDPEVIAIGGRYLRIVAISYIPTAVTFAYGSVLRSIGNTRLPMITTVIALVIKTAISYVLIFGLFGAPEMGVEGAAIGTAIARVLQIFILIIPIYTQKLPIAAKLNEMGGFSPEFVKAYIKVGLPVMVQEVLWSLGMSTYNLVYARIGTQSIAAVNIAGTIENLAFVIFIGISDACAVIIGNQIGANNEANAKRYARYSLTLVTLGGFLVGVLIWLSSGLILELYEISPEAHDFAIQVLTVMAFTLWVKVSNMTIIVGILRSGGDTRYALILEMLTIWLVGVPLALLGAFVFQLPVYWVVLMVAAEELCKYIIGLRRFATGRWVNNLVQHAA